MAETTSHGSALHIMMSVDCAGKKGIGQNDVEKLIHLQREIHLKNSIKGSYIRRKDHIIRVKGHTTKVTRLDAIEYETDGETYEPTFYSITVSNKCLDSVMTHRDSAYTTHDVQPPGLRAVAINCD